MTDRARTPLNPWMIALTVLWCALLGAAIVLAILGASAESLTYDQPGLPPSQELAGIYYACSGVTVLAALVVVGVQLGVGALRWHLDPASRALDREAAADRPRPVRQDF